VLCEQEQFDKATISHVIRSDPKRPDFNVIEDALALALSPAHI
jgi:hypothetical protein